MSFLTDPRALRSRDALHRALLDLLEAKPFDQITIREITALAGIGYTTYFRHYETKDALLDAVMSEQVNSLINLSIPILQAQDLRSACESLFSYVKDHRAIWSTLLTGGAAGTIRDEFLRLVRETPVVRKSSAGNLPTELGMTLIVSGTLELLAWWLRQPTLVAISEMAAVHESVVVTPVIEANYGKRGAKVKFTTRRKKTS